jgi:hypothetical protein
MTLARLALAIFTLLSFTGCNDIGIDIDPTDLQYSVAGVVRDAATNNPVEGVKVTVGSRTGTSAANGTYVVANLPKATLPLTAEKSGYQTLTTNVTVDVLITQKNLSLQRP